MAVAKIFSTRVRSWELLIENLGPHLTDMPHVQALHDELEELIETARALDVEQEEARAKLFDLIHRRQDVERQGGIIRRRIEAHLRGTYGYASEQLIKFGIKPRPRVIRRTSEAETPPAPPPGAPEEPPIE